MSSLNAITVDGGSSAEESPQLLAFGEPLTIPLEAFSDLRSAEPRPEFRSAQLPTEVNVLLTNYSARSSPERIRSAITAFVKLAALAVAPQNSFTCEQVTAPLARLAIWAHHSRGFPLIPTLVFSPEVLELFVADQQSAKEISMGTLRNYRAHIVRVGLALGLATDAVSAPVTRDKNTLPYSTSEILGYKLWARSRRSPRSRTRTETILALSVGAGLRNEEILALRANDVIRADEMWVRVRGDHDRLVPVRPEWRPVLRERLDALGNDDFVYPDAGEVPTGHVSAWFRSMKGAPQAQRLRTTWLVHHLNNGTDALSLLSWAGIERGESLIKYLPHLTLTADTDYSRALMRARHPAKSVAL